MPLSPDKIWFAYHQTKGLEMLLLQTYRTFGGGDDESVNLKTNFR